jgi:hypothetical protein
MMPRVQTPEDITTPEPKADHKEKPVHVEPEPGVDSNNGTVKPPSSGVEIVGTEQRGDTRYYIMRDLRNGNTVKNVTESSARRLWHYAIQQKENSPVDVKSVEWQGDIGLLRRYRKSGNIRYDLVQRNNGNLRVYYGATEGGMQGPWQQFLDPEDRN